MDVSEVVRERRDVATDARESGATRLGDAMKPNLLDVETVAEA
jgi:hypothetical protein